MSSRTSLSVSDSDLATNRQFKSTLVGPGRLRGFTMVELLVTISIAAVLAAIAVPSLSPIFNNIKQKSTSGLLLNDLNQARGEAIKRNARTLLCVRNSLGTGCDTGVAAATSWLQGWVVCVDADMNGACDPGTASAPNPVVVRSAQEANLTINVVDNASVATSLIRFNSNSTQGAGSSSMNITIGGTWTGAVSRSITVAATGNIAKH
jgi:type IV fimbrial biogenesis protein FimT